MKSTFTHRALALTALCTLGAAACSDVAKDTAVSTPPSASHQAAITSCDGSDTSDFTTVDGDITQSATWSGTVYVKGALKAASGAVLNMAPGTQVVMAQDSSLDFAANANAALQANGSAMAPVHFCGEHAQAGYWTGLTLGAASKLDNVLITDAGQAEHAALTLSGPATTQHVDVSGSAGDGVHAADFAEQSSDLTVEGSAAIGLVLQAGAALADLPTQLKMVGNADDRVRLRFETIEHDTTVQPLDVAYVQQGALRVTNGATLTMQAGVNYLFDAGASLEVGAEQSAAATVAFLGTVQAPITFDGVVQTSGSWKGIVLTSAASAASKLSNVEIKHAGGAGYAALDIQSAITVDHVKVADSNDGVRLGIDGVSADSQGLSIEGSSGVALKIDANALVHLPDLSIQNNADNRITVEAGAITSSGTVMDFAVPYSVAGDLDTDNAASVTIQPGVKFEMADNSRFMVGADGSAATIMAQGSSDAMIEFRGQSQTAGAWRGVTIGSNVTSDSSLQYVAISDAGGDGLMMGAALTLETSIDVSNSVFTDSAGNGILKLNSDSTDYASANTFTNVETDIGVTTKAALSQLH